MSTLTDDELIQELKKRFDHTKQALYDLKMVTEKLEQVNRKLEESELVKSNFLSNIKNEINNPLTSILGLSQRLSTVGRDDPQTVATVAGMIHAEAFILDFQLRNIFAAAELESGETALQVARVDVDSVLLDIIDSFSHQSEAKRVTVSYSRQGEHDAGSPLLFLTDSEKLHIIFANLLSNAIEFNVEGGRVQVGAEVMDDKLLVTVADTGVGIDPAHVNRIFDRFLQLETGFTKSHKGHGLGLSITKAVIDLMEGNISVACQKGQGCTFTITIPQVETDVEADAFAVDGNEFLFEDDGAEAF